MHSHVVEFLSEVFGRFNVRSTLSIIVRQCLKSLKVKSEAYILFKHSRFRKWNAYTVQQTLGITEKKINLGYFTKSAHVCFTFMFRNDHQCET